MQTLKKLIIVDDDENFNQDLSTFFKYYDFEVISVTNPDDAKSAILEFLPDIILLDIKFASFEYYGLVLLSQFSAHPKIGQIPIIVVTSIQESNVLDLAREYAQGSFEKPFEFIELLSSVNELLRDKTSAPYTLSDHHIYFSLQCNVNRQIDLKVRDGERLEVSNSRLLTSQFVNEKISYGDEKHAGKMLEISKPVGEQIFETVFFEFVESYGRYSGMANLEENLHIQIVSQSDFLRFPIEFMYHNSPPKGTGYLCLAHPLSHKIQSVNTKNMAINAEYFRNLRKNNETLKILLVASNTKPFIENVDREADQLHKDIPDLFKKKGVKVEVDLLPSKDATIKNLKEFLLTDNYDILHFMGHSGFDKNYPDNSYIKLLNSSSEKESYYLYTTELADVVKKCEKMKFVFLNSCQGSKAASEESLTFGYHLGLADAIIKAGIPSMLSYRWAIDDDMAFEFAKEFYQALAITERLDSSALYGRKRLTRLDIRNEAWLSPVLVMQHD